MLLPESCISLTLSFFCRPCDNDPRLWLEASHRIPLPLACVSQPGAVYTGEAAHENAQRHR
jgi:hypothetical protein